MIKVLEKTIMQRKTDSFYCQIPEDLGSYIKTAPNP